MSFERTFYPWELIFTIDRWSCENCFKILQNTFRKISMTWIILHCGSIMSPIDFLLKRYWIRSTCNWSETLWQWSSPRRTSTFSWFWILKILISVHKLLFCYQKVFFPTTKTMNGKWDVPDDYDGNEGFHDSSTAWGPLILYNVNANEELFIFPY